MGFKTVGLVLAGAAILFLIASAAVSFHGWPAVVPTSSPVAVVRNVGPGLAASGPERRVLLGVRRLAAAHSGGPAQAAGGLPASSYTRAPRGLKFRR